MVYLMTPQGVSQMRWRDCKLINVRHLLFLDSAWGLLVVDPGCIQYATRAYVMRVRCEKCSEGPRPTEVR